MSAEKKIQGMVDAAIKQMQANRAELTETAKAVHGEEYAKLLDGTANILTSIKAVSQNEPANSQIHEHLKTAAACVLTCAMYQLFVGRGIDTVSPEAKKLADAFQKDVVAITNHAYRRIDVKLKDLEDDA